MPNGYYIIEIFKWGFILMDFIGFSFKISKVISPYYQLTTTFFNMGFIQFKNVSKVNEIVIIKSCTNEN
jgi:hypothetical protein